MATLQDWSDHCESLPREKQAELIRAIDTLNEDEMFKKQFGWTGLFALRYSFSHEIVQHIDDLKKVARGER